jgi:hypothetical protein
VDDAEHLVGLAVGAWLGRPRLRCRRCALAAVAVDAVELDRVDAASMPTLGTPVSSFT